MTEITIERPDNETIEIHLDGQLVASANHDEYGWSGMYAVEKTALAISRALTADERSYGAEKITNTAERSAAPVPSRRAQNGVDLDAIAARANTAYEWIQAAGVASGDGWLPLSVRMHFGEDMPALLAAALGARGQEAQDLAGGLDVALADLYEAIDLHDIDACSRAYDRLRAALVRADDGHLPDGLLLAFLRQANAEEDLDVAEEDLLTHPRTDTYRLLLRAAYATGWAIRAGFKVSVSDMGDRVEIGDGSAPPAAAQGWRPPDLVDEPVLPDLWKGLAKRVENDRG
jgi:hypothetical protein